MNWIKPDWALPKHVHAAVTLRTGGVSTGCYGSLNPATHVNDNPEHVAINRQIISDALQLPSAPVWLQQVHGIDVIKADQTHELLPADASYTDQAGVVCAILTADCLPVLFCGDDGEVIGAAHAGWRGLQAGILRETVAKMNCKKIQVWFGPAISAEHFEVGADVYQAFISENPLAARAFTATAPDKWLADIYQLARIDLAECGVSEIYGGGLCTFADAQRFYSYRRDGAATGRMASLIWRD